MGYLNISDTRKEIRHPVKRFQSEMVKHFCNIHTEKNH